MNVLVLTDNELMYNEFNRILVKYKKNIKGISFKFAYSPRNREFKNKFKNINKFNKLSIKKNIDKIISSFDLIFSLHSKQIFPEKLVECVRCINVHPGFNPYNRGYFPQVFSIINKKKVGVTIHLMDKELDHGDIIFREEVIPHSWDTSYTLYNRIQKKEIELLDKYFINIIHGNYNLLKPEIEGNINYFKDFRALCELDLNETLTMKEAIDKLRALTHGEYKNAYFYDDLGNKIFVGINLINEFNNKYDK